MGYFSTEKRLYPRIGIEVPITISNHTSSKTLNVSESGLCFISDEVMLDGDLPVSLHLSSGPYDATMRIAWRKFLDKENKFFYGAEFVYSDLVGSNLREILIKELIKDTLSLTEKLEVRDKISEFFLRDLKSFLDAADEISKEVRKKNSDKSVLMKRFKNINDVIVLKGYELEKSIQNKRVIKAIKESFRLLVSTLAYKSLIVKRAFEKPRGYPGDYGMIENVYNNRPYSEGVGELYDKYFLRREDCHVFGIRDCQLKKI